MVRVDFYGGPKSLDLFYSLQGSVSMDIPRFTNRFMRNVLFTMRMVEDDKETWGYLYVDGVYVGLILYSGMLEGFSFVNRGGDKVYSYDRRRRAPYDRQAS